MASRSDLHLLAYLARQKQKSFWYARHNAISTKAWFRTNLRASIKLITGTSKNSMEDFTILYKICVFGNHPVSPNITQVSWNLPPSGWIKVNIDGSVKGAPGHGLHQGYLFLLLGNKLCFRSRINGFHFGYRNCIQLELI